MKRYFFILLSGMILLIGCCENSCDHNSNGQTNDLYGSSDYLINATLWYQHSAELRACYYQAFNVAKVALDNNLKNYQGEKPPAIVLDLDETILDNSPYQADLIFNELSYTPENWKAWTEKKCALALPGSIDFLEYAVNTDVEIFYVSNRRVNEIEDTYINITELGFPEVPIENYIFREDEGSKIARRAQIREDYEIILLLGDNVNDFAGVFEDRSDNNGFEAIDDNIEKFGTKYIVFPNPMYGNWERVLYPDNDYSDHQNRLNALIGTEKVCK